MLVGCDYNDQCQLIHEEVKQGGEQPISGAEAALIGKPYKGKHEPLRCFKCNAAGHIRRNCPFIKNKSQKPFKNSHKAKTAEDQVSS